MNNLKKVALFLLGAFVLANNYTEAQKVELGNKALEAMAQEIFIEAKSLSIFLLSPQVILSQLETIFSLQIVWT